LIHDTRNGWESNRFSETLFGVGISKAKSGIQKFKPFPNILEGKTFGAL
jgi:hypothetical protein